MSKPVDGELVKEPQITKWVHYLMCLPHPIERKTKLIHLGRHKCMHPNSNTSLNIAIEDYWTSHEEDAPFDIDEEKREQQIEGEEETSVGLTNYPKNPPTVITIDLCTITIMAYSAMNKSWRYKSRSTWRVMLLNTTMKIMNYVTQL